MNEEIVTIEDATTEDVIGARPGDYIIWEHTRQRGRVTHTTRREGIAHYLKPDGYWVAEDGEWLTWPEADGVTITIHRTVKEVQA